MELIDGYTHCGLSKYEPIEQVRRVMETASVRRAVLVQHLGEFDNSYLESIVAGDPQRFAGVCLVSHTEPDAADKIAQLAEAGHFKGLRVPADPEPALWLLVSAAAALELIVVLYAPQGVSRLVRPLMQVLDRHPRLRLVITHLGNPDLADAPHFETYRDVFRLAKYPGVYFQISGMKMFCTYPHEPLYGLIAEALAHFGPERLCWGSNYPVVGDQRDYLADLELLLNGKLPLPQEAIPLVAGENARRLWFD